MFRLRLLTTTIVAAALLAPAGCSPSSGTSGGPANAGQGGATQLQEVEVRSYQGQDLSSVNDFRENSIKGPQHVDIATYRLKIDGLVETPLELTYSQVASETPAYKKVVTLNCVEGWSVDILWEGVKITDLLERAGIDPAATVVIFRSADGYSTSLPFGFVRDRDILLAYKVNDVVLPPERGYPFMVVAEDKWGYKWAKWVTEIELSDDATFRGYWEQRGYSNDGSLDKSFF